VNAQAAVIGDPIEHSASPILFKIFAEDMKKDLVYEKRHVTGDGLKAAFDEAKTSMVGWNVTVPHKEKVLTLCDEVDDTARAVGAANVVHFVGGKAKAYNTDAAGFLAPLKEVPKDCVVLGAGGAARAVVHALKGKGCSVKIINRSKDRARKLCQDFGVIEGTAQDIATADLVVNATSAGLGGGSPLEDSTTFKKGSLAYELVYKPARTRFMEQAEGHGARTLSGAAMLAAQAAETWKIWFGQTLPEQSVNRAETALMEGR